MSRLFKRGALAPSGGLLPARPSGRGFRTLWRSDAAMRNSVVWACTRLRANLISSLPVDVYVKSQLGGQFETDKPPILVNPGGQRVGMREWLYSSQMDLDRVGNTYGIISEIDGQNLPRRIDLVSHADVIVRVKDEVITYVIRNKVYAEEEIWHERQYTVPGVVMGLSPISYAAWQLGLWESTVQFAADWFSNNGMIPSGHLRNLSRTLEDGEAAKVKDRYKASIEGGDIFVTGRDWEFSTKNTPQVDASFMQQERHTDRDIVRFFDVPGDLVEVNASGSSITYANITERNLQFLIMSLGPAVGRREEALSKLVAAPRFVKLKTEALLRMDPETVSKVLAAEVAGRITAPSEARALMNRAPFTPEQLQEFKDLWPNIFAQGAAKSGAGQPDAAEARQVAELIQKIYLGVGKVITADEARDIANRAGAQLTGSFTPEGL